MAVGAVGSSNNMGFDEKMEAGDKSRALETKTSEPMSANQVGVDESSQNAAEEEEEEVERKIKLGPQFTLKEQLEKDKVCFCWLPNPTLKAFLKNKSIHLFPVL